MNMEDYYPNVSLEYGYSSKFKFENGNLFRNIYWASDKSILDSYWKNNAWSFRTRRTFEWVNGEVLESGGFARSKSLPDISPLWTAWQTNTTHNTYQDQNFQTAYLSWGKNIDIGSETFRQGLRIMANGVFDNRIAFSWTRVMEYFETYENPVIWDSTVWEDVIRVRFMHGTTGPGDTQCENKPDDFNHQFGFASYQNDFYLAPGLGYIRIDYNFDEKICSGRQSCYVDPSLT